MKSLKKILSCILIMTIFAQLIVCANVFADTINLAIYSPAKKLDLWAVKHMVGDEQVLANTTVVASSNNNAFGGASAVLDGESMVGMPSGVDPDVILTDRMDLNGENFVKHKSRWAAGGKDSEQSLTFSFKNDIIFNKIRFSEVRSVIGKYEVVCYKDDSIIYRYENEFTGGFSNTKLVLKEINLPQTVSVDKVELKFKSWMNSNVISVTEVEFWGFENANGAANIKGSTDNGTTDLTDNLKNAFDGNMDTIYSIDVDEIFEPVEIVFDYLDIVIADTLYIRTEDVDEVQIFGSIDLENYFEMDYTCDNDCYSFGGEYLKSVKIVFSPRDDRSTVNISDIELYELEENSEIHEMMDFFNGEDTSYITNEDIKNITQPLNLLPRTLGSYDIEWESEDNTIINVETGDLTKKYVSQNVDIYANFMRNGNVYKTNTYSLTIADDGSLESKNKFNYNNEYTNLGKNIVSSKVWDLNNLDPTNTEASCGLVNALYDESDKKQDFDSSNPKSWSVVSLTSSKYVYNFPYTFQFDFDKVLPISKLDIHEFRNRLKKLHIDVSLDGETWTTVANNVVFDSAVNSAEQIYVKSVKLPHCYAKHVRVIVDAVENTTSYAAIKLCEFVFYDEQDIPVTANGESAINVVDRNADTYVEIAEMEEITIDLGTIDGFSGLRWTSDGAPVENYRVSISNDGETWEEIASSSLEENHIIADIAFDYQIARFIKLNIDSVYSNESAKISELYVVEDSEKDSFVLEKSFVELIKNNSTKILADEKLSLLSANEIDICNSVGDFNIEWDFSKAPMIDSQTGTVTHGEEDIIGEIDVKVSFKDNGIVFYTNSFEVVSKSVLDINEYHFATIKQTLSTNVYDFDRPEGFLFNQKEMILEFDIFDDGTVSVCSNSELFNVKIDGTNIIIGYKEGTETVEYDGGAVKVRALLYDEKFDIYLNYDNTRYKGILSQAEYINDNTEGLKTIEITGADIENIRFGMHKDYLPEFLEQLDFSFISNENMYAVTNDMIFKNEIIRLPLVWESSDNSIVNAISGQVNTQSQPGYVKLTAKTELGSEFEWSKELYASINLPNIISEADVTVNAITYNGNVIDNIVDNSIITSYLTNYKNGYTISIKFPEKKMLSQVALIEDRTYGSIKSYDIYIDNNKVYSGAEMNGFSNCILDCMEGKEIKINVNSTEGITGFSEIAVHSEVTDSQKVKMDSSLVAIQERYSNGTYSFPATGMYGSTLQYLASNDIVSFTKEGNIFKMKVENNSIDTGVTITVNASIGNEKIAKSYSIIAVGKQTISSSPSNGGGGSSGGKQNLYAGTTSTPGAEAYVPAEKKDELSGHWGEKEIRSLIQDGIVMGDGHGYSLDKNVTRAEFITMLLRALKKDLSNNLPQFDDVSKNEWYSDEMQTAFELGWIVGYNNYASPLANITREEMAKIICKALELEIIDEMSLDFVDKNEQSAWAVDYINSLYLHDIIKGYDDGTFRPKNPLKRDEAMMVIYRTLNKGGQ